MTSLSYLRDDKFEVIRDNKSFKEIMILRMYVCMCYNEIEINSSTYNLLKLPLQKPLWCNKSSAGLKTLQKHLVTLTGHNY